MPLSPIFLSTFQPRAQYSPREKKNDYRLDILKKMRKNNFKIDIYDPYASKDEVYRKHNFQLLDYNQIKEKYYNCILVAVAHTQFINLNLKNYILNKNTLIYDLKGLYNNKDYMRL